LPESIACPIEHMQEALQRLDYHRGKLTAALHWYAITR
jgi:hypothetical protein